MTRKRLWLYLISVIATVSAVAIALWLGLEMAGVKMSGHGFAAIFAGAVLTLLMSFGLFALVFHSARHGHDDTGHWRGGDEGRE